MRFGLWHFTPSLSHTLLSLSLARALSHLVQNSDFMTKLNGGGDSAPGVAHANIATKYDEVVTPWQNSYQTASGTTNVLLQNFCGISINEHRKFLSITCNGCSQVIIIVTVVLPVSHLVSHLPSPSSHHDQLQGRSAICDEPAEPLHCQLSQLPLLHFPALRPMTMAGKKERVLSTLFSFILARDEGACRLDDTC